MTALPLDAIKIGSRFRQDHGDIGALARSIADIGLLHPIVVAKLFGESSSQVERRAAVVSAARADPEQFGKLKSDMDRTGRVNGPFKRLKVMRQVAAIRAIFLEVKEAGYDLATVRTIIKRRAMDPETRHVRTTLLDQYMTALGDFAGTPLGQAGADRMRGEARA